MTQQDINTQLVPANAPLGELPGIPGITQADVDMLAKAKAIEQKQKLDGALVRFESAFKLEAEVIGQTKATRKKVSKSGAVSLNLLPLNSKDGLSLSSISGFKGEELKAFARLKSDELKGASAQLVTRIQGDNEWTGLGYGLSSKGDTLTVRFKKVEKMGVSVTKEMSEEEMLKKLGLTPEEYAPIKAAKLAALAKAEAEANAKAIADEKAKADAEREELEKLAKEIADLDEVGDNAKTNGEVHEVHPAE